MNKHGSGKKQLNETITDHKKESQSHTVDRKSLIKNIKSKKKETR